MIQDPMDLDGLPSLHTEGSSDSGSETDFNSRPWCCPREFACAFGTWVLHQQNYQLRHYPHHYRHLWQVWDCPFLLFLLVRRMEESICESLLSKP